MCHILLIDDNAEKRFLYSRILKYLGCEVVEFPDAIMAQKLLQFRNPFDLIITDLYMPVINGMQFSEWVKRRYPDVPVILISAAPSPRLESITHQREPDYYLFGYLNRDRFKRALDALYFSY
jgi:CheY-like chemotaxis protein